MAPAPQIDGSTVSASRVLLSWQVHLVRRDPLKLFPIIACAALAGSVGYSVMQHPLYAVLGVFLVVSSCGDYLLPIRCQLTESGATSRCGIGRYEMPWTDVKRVLEGVGEIRLSPLDAPSRLERTRGVPLRLAPDGSPGDRQSVIAIIDEYRPRPEPGSDHA